MTTVIVITSKDHFVEREMEFQILWPLGLVSGLAGRTVPVSGLQCTVLSTLPPACLHTSPDHVLVTSSGSLQCRQILTTDGAVLN